MAQGYGSHKSYMESVASEARARGDAISHALRRAFARFIEKRSVEVISFSEMSFGDLADAMVSEPAIVKPILAAANVAARAIERDLDIRNLDTYEPKLSRDNAIALATYVRPHLPAVLEVPTLVYVDRVYFVDKEVRMSKGRWERKVLDVLNRFSASEFRKRKFDVGGDKFELDAATPPTGNIRVGVDVKRIEARRDIHKRCDEIVNKAAKLRKAASGSRFGVVIYYPFVDEHVNIQSRLRSDAIDAVVFASEGDESVENAVRLLLAQLRFSK